jgi:uncharacterized cofD-like protein
MKKVVTIGGGTGSFMLLSGLKKYPIQISAIVSMADDGGSTGILRDELGVLPPGDARQCLVALSDSSEMLRKLMNYRFENGTLLGHNFGNIFLSALEKINRSFLKGIEEAAKILNVRGEVIPVTETDSSLYMELKTGKILKGEEEINHSQDIQKIGIRKNYLKPVAGANKKALQRIIDADMIIIGPGNHYCSIAPNFLVKGISGAIRNSKAKVVYNCNLINKLKHTENFTLDDYVDSINGYLGSERVNYVTFNTKKPDKRLIKKYAKHRELLIDFQENRRKKRNYRIIRTDILSDKRPKYSKADTLAAQRSFIRHDSEKLAKILMMVLELGDYENIIKEIV